MFKSKLDYKKVYDALVNEFKDYVKKCHLHGAVLGVSGGIDSTVVAAIAYKAKEDLLKEGYKFKLLGISMPTHTSFENEVFASIKVRNAFFTDSLSLVINDPAEGISKAVFGKQEETGHDIWGENNSPETVRLRNGNIKSRTRMVLLYDAAKAINGIVLGTDNYSEYLLGFSTIGGDALFDYCPIQYLWKTEVFGLAKYIETLYSLKPGIKDAERCDAVKSSLALKPMDGLGISNDDMEQIGARDYLEVDTILYNHINGLERDPEVTAETEKKVLDRMRWTEYKRNHPVRVPRSAYE